MIINTKGKYIQRNISATHNHLNKIFQIDKFELPVRKLKVIDD